MLVVAEKMWDHIEGFGFFIIRGLRERNWPSWLSPMQLLGMVEVMARQSGSAWVYNFTFIFLFIHVLSNQMELFFVTLGRGYLFIIYPGCAYFFFVV